MKWIWAVFLLSASLVSAAQPHGVGTCEPDGVQDSGAIYRVCLPQETEWNGDLVIYCHGYIRPDGLVDLPEDQFCFGSLCIYELFNQFGYAFAATSYSTHGVAVREGVADTIDLIDIFSAQYGTPNNIILVGFSEGAQIAILIAERYPELIDGVVAACGPIGDWQRQVEYIGDFRVLFDVFFPDLIPGSPLEIPEDVVTNWDDIWRTQVRPVLELPENRWKVRQLLHYSGAPSHPLEYNRTLGGTVSGVLWFNIVGTNDAIHKLGGQPFSNEQKLYLGGLGASFVNYFIERTGADAAAIDLIAREFQTSGRLQVPTVTVHTFLDPQVPYWHEPLYELKVIEQGFSHNLTHIPVAAFGHCNFSAIEIVAAFSIVTFQATGEFPDFSAAFEDAKQAQDYLAIVEEKLFK